MSKISEPSNEPRRGSGAKEEAYLKLVGERVRLHRVRRSMSRKALSQASGVSERYLAELERGTGNASLLVLRQIAAAMDIKIADLTSDDIDRPLDLQLSIHQLERLTPAQLAEARILLATRFGRPLATPKDRIALVGLRGPAKAAIGKETARAFGVPHVELDAEIERVSGMDVSEILAVHGQTVYRKIEQDCLRSVIDAYNRVVITVGGGIVTSPETLELLLSSCFVIWLKAAGVAADTGATTAGRASSIAEFTAAREAREPLLAKVDCEIDATAKTTEQVLRDLFAALTTRAERATGT